MRTGPFAVVVAAVVVAAGLPALAGEIKVEPGQKYLMLATSKSSTMEDELQQASKAGFRIVTTSPGSKEIVYLLKRVDDPSPDHSYKLLATSKISTMEKELNEAAAQGFRAVKGTVMSKPHIFGTYEIVVVMEPGPEGQKFDYKVLGTSRTGTLQKEITEASDAGFTLVGMGTVNEHTAVMERAAN